MNNGQKIAMAAATCLAVLAIFMHNPMSGYTVKSRPIGLNSVLSPNECSEAEKAEWRETFRTGKRLKLNNYTPEEIEEKVKECRSYGDPDELLPFDQWMSNHAHWGWLGGVKNLLFTLGSIFVAAVCVAYIFHTPKLPADKAVDTR